MSCKYEFYNPNSNVAKSLLQIQIKESSHADIESIASIIAERNQNRPEQYFERVKNELDGIKKGNNDHFLYSAVCNNTVICFGRLIYHDSKDCPKIKNSPTGWWIMGVVVAKKFRRKGIGEQIFCHLEQVAKSFGGEDFYSFINKNNLTSKDLHEKIGFKQINQGSSFLGVDFDGGEGLLFWKDLNK